jgi:LSD1 subclass zinc finger protein
MLRLYKGTAVLSALMKGYTIPCHDTGQIDVMFVLQSCTDPLHILPGSSSEKCAISSDGACNFSNIDVEEDLDIIEEGVVAIKKEVGIHINQEEFPVDMTFSGIMSELDKASSMCAYVY